MDTTQTLTVLRPGLMSTIQDMGRPAHRGIGVATGGAMDVYSLRVANALVGNQPGDAALEMTLLGPTLRAETDIVAAVAGADLSPRIDDNPILSSVFAMRTGQVLTFARPIGGVRAYLAVAGGFDVPVALGSRSTFIRAAFGGFEGRALRSGDVLQGRKRQPSDSHHLGWRVMPDGVRSAERAIRILAGPHLGSFASEVWDLLLGSEYTVSHESDRMGVRLHGPALVAAASAEMVSEPVPLGAIQVPPNGQPIILMADQQTTGGYPLIAAVIAADVPAVAQRAPGAELRFAAVTLAAAHEAWRLMHQELATIEMGARLRR